jgi:hypothetical protein
MSDMTQMKPGDRMAVYSKRGGLSGTATVDRVTKTQIITTTGAKFRRKDGYLVGGDMTWGCESVKELTPELEAQVKAEMQRRKLTDRFYRLFTQSKKMTADRVRNYTAALDAAVEKGGSGS